MVTVENVTMEFDLNRGKIRSLKEKIFDNVNEELSKKILFKAISEVSFRVNNGEIFGIIGSNGAGKSTLLKILSGIMKPSQGKVYIEGTIAPMIELGAGFDFELSALENIYLNGAILGHNKKFIDSKVCDIFNFSELWDFKDVPIKYFSSGMIARLAFSISTLVIPDVLIIDEVLSVGDISFQKKSYSRMIELMTSGSTVIYVSHDIESLKNICDNVMWLDKGKIKMIGNSIDVCNKFKDEFK